MDLQDIDVGNISNNYILHQTIATNSAGLSVTGSPSFRNVTLQGNTFYAVGGGALKLAPRAIWEGISISNNFLLAPPTGACTVSNNGGFTGTTYSNNKYSGANSFCLGNTPVSLSTWVNSSGESPIAMFTGALIDPTRTLGTYARSLGYADAAAFLAASQQMHRYNWNPALTAPAVNAYIKAGFALVSAPPDHTAPSIPTNLTATTISSSQVILSWTASTDNIAVTGYRIYRGGALIATIGTATTFSSTGLTANTAYSYTVSAIDAISNASAQSTSASATTPSETTWVTVAQEGQSFTVPALTLTRYGANGIWVERALSGTISCSNGTYGDPVPGIVKSCQTAAR